MQKSANYCPNFADSAGGMDASTADVLEEMRKVSRLIDSRVFSVSHDTPLATTATLNA